MNFDDFEDELEPVSNFGNNMFAMNSNSMFDGIDGMDGMDGFDMLSPNLPPLSSIGMEEMDPYLNTALPTNVDSLGPYFFAEQDSGLTYDYHRTPGKYTVFFMTLYFLVVVLAILCLMGLCITILVFFVEIRNTLNNSTIDYKPVYIPYLANLPPQIVFPY